MQFQGKKYICRLGNIMAMAMVWFMCMFVPVIADEQEDFNTHEYKVKIAFIYNFLKFVDWPGGNAPKKTNAANVCILGDKEFSNYFKDLQNFHQQDLKININDSVSGKDIASCHILFIGKKEEDNVAAILANAKRQPVLSISEAKDFVENGGIIEISREGKSVGLYSKENIKLRINLKTAEADNLSIDARLLQIAKEVIK